MRPRRGDLGRPHGPCGLGLRGRLAALMLAAALLPAGPAGAAMAAGVADMLTRPATPVRQPGRALLLDASLAGSRAVAVGEHGLVALSDDAGASWRQARSVPTSVTLTGVRFVDVRQGWAVGHSGVVLHSDDGGDTWARQLDGVAAAKLVLAAEQAASPVVPQRLAAARQLVADGPDKPWLALHFFDAQRGVLVGAYGLAVATADGGRSWQPWLDRIDNPKGLHLYAIAAVGQTLYLAGEQGLLLRSRDAGRHFEPLASPYAGSWFTLAALPASPASPAPPGTPGGMLVAAGLRGNSFVSHDAGDHWQALSPAAPVSMIDAVAWGDGRILLANQAGLLYAASAHSSLLAPWAAPGAGPLPPLQKILRLPDGSLLALTAAGARRVPAPVPAPLPVPVSPADAAQRSAADQPAPGGSRR